MSSEQHGPEEGLSRREALKAAAALGAAVAASSLVPSRWSKPKVGVGALPAHAQGTVVPPPPGEELTCIASPYVGAQIVPGDPIFFDSKVALEATLDPATAGVELRVDVQILGPGGEVLRTFSTTVTTDALGHVLVNYVIRGVTEAGSTLVANWTRVGGDTDCETVSMILLQNT